ncbi:hypothetical protein J3U72_10515 [Lactobacillus sp. B4012]|nr:hypothetical protein [Lactobacillus sp. B4010]MCX8733379.1 hypothetical protein [Lactobacillus sp. B4015]MCX8735500.1 hypothetical protein [Lactobacillus sp. B4012]
MGYNQYNWFSVNTGGFPSGIYIIRFDTQFKTLNLKIPRDRIGDFKQQTMPNNDRLKNKPRPNFKHFAQLL